jgi:hypothetical protein
MAGRSFFSGSMEDVEGVLMANAIAAVLFEPSMRSFLVTVRRLVVIPPAHARVVTLTLRPHHLVPVPRIPLRAPPAVLHMALPRDSIIARLWRRIVCLICVVILVEVTGSLRLPHECLWSICA